MRTVQNSRVFADIRDTERVRALLRPDYSEEERERLVSSLRTVRWVFTEWVPYVKSHPVPHVLMADFLGENVAGKYIPSIPNAFFISPDLAGRGEIEILGVLSHESVHMYRFDEGIDKLGRRDRELRSFRSTPRKRHMRRIIVEYAAYLGSEAFLMTAAQANRIGPVPPLNPESGVRESLTHTLARGFALKRLSMSGDPEACTKEALTLPMDKIKAEIRKQLLEDISIN